MRLSFYKDKLGNDYLKKCPACKCKDVRVYEVISNTDLYECSECGITLDGYGGPMGDWTMYKGLEWYKKNITEK